MPPVTASGNELSQGSVIDLLVFTGVSACFAVCFVFAFLYFSPSLSLQNNGDKNIGAPVHNHGPRPRSHSHAQNTQSPKTRIDDVESRVVFPTGSPDIKVEVDDCAAASKTVPRPTSRHLSPSNHAPVGHVRSQPSVSLSISTASSMEPLDRELSSSASGSPPVAPEATQTLAEAAKKIFQGHATDNDHNEDGKPQDLFVYPPFPIRTTPVSAPATCDAFTVNSTPVTPTPGKSLGFRTSTRFSLPSVGVTVPSLSLNRRVRSALSWSPLPRSRDIEEGEDEGQRRLLSSSARNWEREQKLIPMLEDSWLI